MKPFIEEYCAEYEHSTQELYLRIANKRKSKRICAAMGNRQIMSRTWQAGMVGIIGFHLHRLNNWLTVLFQLTLWSAGFGLACYVWLDGEYTRLARVQARRIVQDMEKARAATQSNAWVAVKDRHVTGALALWVDKEDEGRINSLTGVESRIEPALVNTTIQFARRQDVKVIIHDATWSTSPF